MRAELDAWRFDDRYRDAGLTGNPFGGKEHTGGGAMFVTRGLPDPPPSGSATLVQVIGEKGAGKTTQLHVWRERNMGPYHYVPPEPYRHRWRPPPVAPIVYGDEIDRMPWPLRWLWLRRLAADRATAIIGTHVDLSAIAAGCGLAVVTHRLEPVDRATLDAIIEARLRGAARVSAGHLRFRFSDADLHAIHAESGGSIRDAEVHCHKLLAQRVH